MKHKFGKIKKTASQQNLLDLIEEANASES